MHLLFDSLAYLVGFLITFWLYRGNKKQLITNSQMKLYYYFSVALGAMVGAILLGTLNLYISQYDSSYIGKSVLGALLGAIVGVEIFKKIYNIHTSTGAYFVPSLAIGIAIGRIGCFLSGLDDFTHGTPTDFILAYNFGDGIPRHPVQLYESVAMFVFFVYSLLIYKYKKKLFIEQIFYHFVLYYNLQRFLWEFIKPYEALFLGLNIFQYINIVLIIYALYFIKKQKEPYGTLL